MKTSIVTSWAIAMAIFLAACSSSTTTPPSTSGKKTPATGSTFTSTTYDTTSSGTSSFVSTDSVVASGIPYGGKSNVVESYTINNGQVIDTGYSTYESNGDISTINGNTRFLAQVFPNFTWLTISFASQTTVTLAQKDSNLMIGGIPVQAHFALVSTGMGTGTTVINGQTLSTGTAKITLTASAAGSQYVLRESIATLSQTIGWFVTEDQPALAAVFGIALQPNGSHAQLTGYTEF